KAYPVEERNWLLATSFNTGFGCLEASMLYEAKRWFEYATVICRFVPRGKERADKVCVPPLTQLLASLIDRFHEISETYMRLLARYNPD
ncbi:hypothetical protein B0H11DRAFT_1747089, partial [Mycena galericulata]